MHIDKSMEFWARLAKGIGFVTSKWNPNVVLLEPKRRGRIGIWKEMIQQG